MKPIRFNNFKATSKGFSLIEVLVALVVSAVGLLGIAKMEALAFSSERTASSKSLAAMQAASLAAAMHANAGYWAAGTAPASISVDATSATPAFTSSDSSLSGDLTSGPQPCDSGATPSCTSIQMAAFDIQTWTSDLQKILPSYQAVITCVTNNLPVSCTIQISWTEKTVSINSQGASASAALSNPSYTLYVVP